MRSSGKKVRTAPFTAWREADMAALPLGSVSSSVKK
jgi:hypothetical protein